MGKLVKYSEVPLRLRASFDDLQYGMVLIGRASGVEGTVKVVDKSNRQVCLQTPDGLKVFTDKMIERGYRTKELEVPLDRMPDGIIFVKELKVFVKVRNQAHMIGIVRQHKYFEEVESSYFVPLQRVTNTIIQLEL